MVLRFLQRRQKYAIRQVRLNGHAVRLMVADTLLKRAIGLMFRERLAPGTGMLFLFGSKGMHGIWMRNMRFPIDVVWMDGDKVVSVAERLAPFDPRIRYPVAPADSIIELAAGSAKKYKIKEGKKIAKG